MTLTVFASNQTPNAPFVDWHRRGVPYLDDGQVDGGALKADSEWVEAWHPTTQLSYATLLRAVRVHQSRYGAHIDVGFLPKPDGSCHLVGPRFAVFKALDAVSEICDVCTSEWRFVDGVE